MAGPYDIYPAVDSNYNFPPEVRAALVQSSDVQAALTAAGVDGGNRGRAAAAIDSEAAKTGFIQPFAGTTAPNNWLVCNGQAVSRTTYAALFSVIGTQYGTGDGSTTFNLPNLLGRVAVGMDSAQTEFNAVGKTGGEKAHVQLVSELAQHSHVQDAHSHSGTTNNAGTHGHGNYTNGVGDHSHTGYTDNQGTHSHGGGTGYSGDHAHGASTLDGFQTYKTSTATRALLSTASGSRYAISSTDINSLGYGSTNTAGGHTHGIGNDGGHTHNIQTYNAGGHNHYINNDGDHNHSFGTGGTTATNQNTGSSAAANVLQPYMALLYLIHI